MLRQVGECKVQTGCIDGTVHGWRTVEFFASRAFTTCTFVHMFTVVETRPGQAGIGRGVNITCLIHTFHKQVGSAQARWHHRTSDDRESTPCGDHPGVCGGLQPHRKRSGTCRACNTNHLEFSSPIVKSRTPSPTQSTLKLWLKSPLSCRRLPSS